MRPYLFVVVVLLGFVFAGNSDRCPSVFDGLTNGHFDMSTQFSTSSLSANWNGLSSNEVLFYECAVISEAVLREKQISSTCRSTQGFLGLPDVKGWVSVRKDNSVTFSNLKLTPGVKYYIVLRTTLSSGVQVYSNTNGIVVLPQELKLEGTNAKRDVKSIDEEHDSSIRHSHAVRKPQPRSTGVCYDGSCPIDEENRCRAAKVSVQDFLNQFYGPPRWSDNLEFFLFGFLIFPPVEGPDDDDDDGYSHAENDGIIAGVIAGALLLILFLLCLLCLLALFVGARGGGEQPFGETIQSNKTDHVDADLGSTTSHSIGNNTRVEFPDLDPQSRLSQA